MFGRVLFSSAWVLALTRWDGNQKQLRKKKNKNYPTDPFTPLEFLNVSELHKIRQYPDFQAVKVGKGQPGS